MAESSICVLFTRIPTVALFPSTCAPAYTFGECGIGSNSRIEVLLHKISGGLD